MIFSRKGRTHADRPAAHAASRALAQLANGGGGTTPAPPFPPDGLPRTLSRPGPLDVQCPPRSRSQPRREWSCQLSTVPRTATDDSLPTAATFPLRDGRSACDEQMDLCRILMCRAWFTCSTLYCPDGPSRIEFEPLRMAPSMLGFC
jgi:hypothetical protein